MKYALKMLLAPTSRDNPAETKLDELDGELKNILNRKDLDMNDKIKFYNQILSRFLAIDQNVRKSHPPTPVENMSLKRKPSDYELDEYIRKIKRSETKVNNVHEEDRNVKEFDKDLDDDFDNEIITSNDQADNFNPQRIDLAKMVDLNQSLMKKSPSFDHAREHNKFLKPLEPKRNKFDFFKNRWINYY